MKPKEQQESLRWREKDALLWPVFCSSHSDACCGCGCFCCRFRYWYKRMYGWSVGAGVWGFGLLLSSCGALRSSTTATFLSRVPVQMSESRAPRPLASSRFSFGGVVLACRGGLRVMIKVMWRKGQGGHVLHVLSSCEIACILTESHSGNLTLKSTFTFKAFSRCFYPKRLYLCRYSKDVHRTKWSTDNR